MMKTILRWAAASLALLALVAGAVLLSAYRSFGRLVRADVDALLAAAARAEAIVVTDDMLRDLPEPVRRYLTHAGVVGSTIPRSVRLSQAGLMHQSPTQPWLPIDAQQHYTVRPPGFVWDATMRLGPLPLVRARDRYLRGTGNMLVKAGALYPIADAQGPEMDQGAMMRYLSEMIWFPAAFLGDNISFEPVDDRSARVTMTDHGRSVSGTLHIDDEGRLTDFVAQRYRALDGGYSLDTWSTPVTEYGELAGLKLPVRGKAVWKLAEGDLEYIDVTITELEYDVER